MRFRFLASAVVLTMTSTACLAVDKGLQPAQLVDTSEDALVKLSSSVAEVLGVAKVELGPIDHASATNLTVLPPRSTPLEGNNPALPRSFKVYSQRGGCWLFEAATSDYYQLQDISCELIETD